MTSALDRHGDAVIVESTRETRTRHDETKKALRRAAVVGGVAVAAHHAGTKSAQAQAAEQDQDQQIADLQAQQAAAPVRPAPAARRLRRPRPLRSVAPTWSPSSRT